MSSFLDRNANSDTMVLEKLEKIKHIHDHRTHLETMKSELLCEMDATENDDQLMCECRTELERLLEEKMAHVEELRLIHADINLLETTIRQCEDDRNGGIRKLCNMIAQYDNCRNEVRHLMDDVGIEPAEALGTESNLDTDRIRAKLASTISSAASNGSCGSDWSSLALGTGSSTAGATATGAGAAGAGVGAFSSDALMSRSAVAAAAAMQQFGLQLAAAAAQAAAPATAADGDAASSGLRAPPTLGSGSASLRQQQPPPMKSCLSCHQQIHRNAPICPLCKAKSRSRNPKKPKQPAADAKPKPNASASSQPAAL